MKKIVSLIFILSLAACSPQARVDQARRDCSFLGYTPDTGDFNGCVERGYRAGKQKDSSAAGTAAQMLALIALL